MPINKLGCHLAHFLLEWEHTCLPLNSMYSSRWLCRDRVKLQIHTTCRSCVHCVYKWPTFLLLLPPSTSYFRPPGGNDRRWQHRRLEVYVSILERRKREEEKSYVDMLIFSTKWRPFRYNPIRVRAQCMRPSDIGDEVYVGHAMMRSRCNSDEFLSGRQKNWTSFCSLLHPGWFRQNEGTCITGSLYRFWEKRHHLFSHSWGDHNSLTTFTETVCQYDTFSHFNISRKKTSQSQFCTVHTNLELFVDSTLTCNCPSSLFLIYLRFQGSYVERSSEVQVALWVSAL